MTTKYLVSSQQEEYCSIHWQGISPFPERDHFWSAVGEYYCNSVGMVLEILILPLWGRFWTFGPETECVLQLELVDHIDDLDGNSLVPSCRQVQRSDRHCAWSNAFHICSESIDFSGMLSNH